MNFIQTDRLSWVSWCLALPLAFLFFTEIAVAEGGDTARVEREFVSLHLVPASNTSGGNGVVLAALDVELEPGWVFYHETPGEFGIAPEFDWSGSENLVEISLSWPEPLEEVYDTDPPIVTLGYKDAVSLPIEAVVPSLDEPTTLRVHIDYAICDEFCIYDSVDLALSLHTNGAATD